MDGRVVASVKKAPMTKASLRANAYKTKLVEDRSYDVAAIRISAVDENGNTLVFSNEPVSVSIDGPLQVVGPEVVSLRGGMAGVYLKTVGESGRAVVTLSSPSLGKVKIDFEIEK
jgi:beta-galactosidase